MVPDLAMITFCLTVPDCEPRLSILLTKSIPSVTSPVRNPLCQASKVWRDRHTKDNVGAIKPVGDDSSDEKLGTVGIFPSISHGKETRFNVLETEVFICDDA